jgi:predicted helicase
MSQHLIQHYLNSLHDLRKVSGTHRESVVREAFKDLLKGWARSHDLTFIPEYEIASPAKERRYVDGALLYALRMPFGYWEAKDEKDDLDVEIEYKFRRGYPQDNIIFEDSRQAVLIQNRQEVIRCGVDDVTGLERLLTLFFSYERQEVAAFRQAVEQFKVDLPAVLTALREMIQTAFSDNAPFRQASERFLIHAREAINPTLSADDVREMLIQHILTEEIFSKVFGEDDFHRQNNVAKELYNLEGTFFTGDLKKRTLRGLDAYYAAIRSAAAQIGSHHEKQTFLKVIYENFYKVYNAKAADRLGVVYTPNEIVRFMIESADRLCTTHFGKQLIDRNVQILDPASGTGTFICELLEHFRGQPDKLRYKYQEELHANEVAILPYYVANLNIEATFAALTGQYLEYPNLCFVDTLDNVAALRKYSGHIDDLFGSLSDENVGRIRRQNSRTISVVIGNPPYNANQMNENENNKNREYAEIDKRIKETYIRASTAQKTKLYDMYARFFRWASDRLNHDGVLAFVTNRSFIDSRTFDGFRKTVADEFNEVYIVDLGGDVRANPRLSGTKHNVFGIQTGVAISFFVRRFKTKGCRIFYSRQPELATAEEKLAFLGRSRLPEMPFEEIQPDARHNWINLTNNDFDELLPVASKETKAAKKPGQERAIFKLFSLGVSTNRDEWVYDFSKDTLLKRMEFFIDAYNNLADKQGDYDTVIKLSRNLKRRFEQGRKEAFNRDCARRSMYRPFISAWLYDSDLYLDERGACAQIFPKTSEENSTYSIVFTDPTSQKPWLVAAVANIPDLHFVGAAAGTECLPLYRYSEDGTRHDNITDWALNKFRKQYGTTKLTKPDIFHYVYAVLHNPAYREKYALNLKRDFPRIPFYDDFWRWAAWGKELMELHIGYETLEPWALERVDAGAYGHTPLPNPKPILKADKQAGTITLDSQTTLRGIPAQAWEYKLGNRTALEWILDQYKESKPKDPTIREKFNSYRFSDYKEQVIDLIGRVTTVSVRTVAIVEAMREA